MPHKKVKGDRFILCRWSFKFGPMVEESDNSLGRLMSEIPQHLNAGESERLCVCEVGYWTYDTNGDPTNWTPRDVTTLYEIDHYADPAEDYDEENADADAEEAPNPA